jgi:hypothetical protein
MSTLDKYCYQEWDILHSDISLLNNIQSMQKILRMQERKIKYQNTIFHSLFKPMQACLQRSESQMCFI